MSQNSQRLTNLIARVLSVEPQSFSEETTPGEIDTWDSFNGLLMVSELESEFDVHFSMEEVVAIACVGDIKEALSRHGVEFGGVGL